MRTQLSDFGLQFVGPRRLCVAPRSPCAACGVRNRSTRRSEWSSRSLRIANTASNAFCNALRTQKLDSDHGMSARAGFPLLRGRGPRCGVRGARVAIRTAEAVAADACAADAAAAWVNIEYNSEIYIKKLCGLQSIHHRGCGDAVPTRAFYRIDRKRSTYFVLYRL